MEVAACVRSTASPSRKRTPHVKRVEGGGTGSALDEGHHGEDRAFWLVRGPCPAVIVKKWKGRR